MLQTEVLNPQLDHTALRCIGALKHSLHNSDESKIGRGSGGFTGLKVPSGSF